MSEQDGFLKFKVSAPAGVNFSREPSQLNPLLWDEAYNVTFRNGKTFKCNGYEEGFGAARSTPEVIVPLRDDSQSYYWWAYAGVQRSRSQDGGETISEDKIFKVVSSGTHQDVTPEIPEGEIEAIPVKGIWQPSKWYGDTINGTPYLCKEKPYVWDDSVGRFAPMSKFPKHLSFKVMRTFRNFIVGLNFHTTSADPGYPGFSTWVDGTHQDALWWSHDIAGTSLQVGEGETSLWCDADSNRNSGWNFLGGSGGPIVDGKSMRDSFIVYRERSIWQMSFVGGINVFNFKELFDDAGALSGNCVVEIEGRHYVIGQSDVYVHDGVSKKSLVDGVVRRAIFDNIDPSHVDKVFATVDYGNKEFWVCVPWARAEGDPYSGSCNVAFVFNWEENTWSRREIPDLLCSTYTILSISDSDTSWVSPSEFASWASCQDTWLNSGFRYNPADWGFAMGSARSVKFDGEIINDWVDAESWVSDAVWNESDLSTDEYKIFTGISESLYNGSDFSAIVEKKWMAMGDHSDTTFVNKVYPLVRGSNGSSVGGIVDVYMSGTYRASESPSWRYIGRFDSYKMTKLSCRISGNFVHIRFIIPEESRAEIRGYELEWTKIGRRS